MASRTSSLPVTVAALPLLLAGCFDEPPDTQNVVFADDFAPGVVYQAFAKSKLDAAGVESTDRYAGTGSLRFSVPTPGEPGAGEFNFSGGAFTSDRPRNLSRYSAVTFWAKASRGVSLDSVGIGNDNTGASRFQTETKNLALTTSWTRYVIPIPAPAKLGAERGLFWLAAGAKGNPPTGFRIWFDDIKYENLDATGWDPRPTLTLLQKGLNVGSTLQISGTSVAYTVDGRDVQVAVLPATFDYTTSNPSVATVSASGLITATGNGTAVISAKLNGADVPQTVTITVPAGTLAQMDLPVTFDSPTVAYGLLGFGGAEDSSIVADPTGGTNLVVKVVRSATAEVFAGTTLTADGTLGFASPLPFTASATRMTVRVYSPAAGLKVRLKAEDHTDAQTSVETEATTTQANAWETLTFDFATQVGGTSALNLTKTYDKVTIFFNFGVAGSTAGVQTFYFDDVAFASGTTMLSQMDLPVTFDSPTVAYGLLGFGGAEDSTIVVDPTGGTNKVGKVVRSATAEVFAGTTLTADGTLGLASEIPFTASATKMTVRVYAPASGIKVRLKVEDHTNGTNSVETEATTTQAGAWETLTFDFTNNVASTPALDLGKTYDKVIVFFNFGVPGSAAGVQTYYFDDVAFVPGSGLTQMDLPVTFDSPTVAYGLLGFGGAEDSTIVVDPTGGANKVGKVVRSATAEVFAGTTLTADGTLGFASEIPFTASATKMTVRVYAPASGIKVRLKVEDHTNGTNSVETEATTTQAGAWETLTFDFTNNVASTPALDLGKTYDKASIFFNFGVPGSTAGVQTYYFDDVTFVPGGGGFVPITFDDSAVTYTLTGFGGAEDSTVVVDPAGGPNQVSRVVKSGTAELWAGTTVSTGPNQSVPRIPFTASAKTMTVRVWSPVSGIPVRLKVEDAADPTHSVETEATVSVAAGWQTLTFDFANQAPNTAALNLGYTYNKVSIFFNFGTPGSVTGPRTYYFDDVTFVPGGGGGGGGFVPITFDDSAVTYTLTGFGGAEDSTVVVDPAGGPNQVSRIVKSGTAELWAGTTVSTGPNQSVPTIPFTASAKTMTVRVWSPVSGIPVRLKVEDAADPTHSVETEATVSVAAGWQTLTFDFANQAPGTAALDLGYTYNKVSIFFNFGTPGSVTGPRTYYFDDVAFVP